MVLYYTDSTITAHDCSGLACFLIPSCSPVEIQFVPAVIFFFQVNPPQVVQEKILALIQDWADAFRGTPDLSNVLETYETLRAQGFEAYFIIHVYQE